jgi:RNA-directed DNA polymerase
VNALAEELREHWPTVREQLLQGTYVPQPVRGVDIPKPGGGKRTLGIPTVLDRLIQQAMLQVLQPHADRTFSESSYGFRPGRSAHQAVKKAQAHVAEGYRHVVDMDLDLEKFFDRVNHDVLMSRLARRLEDKPILGTIRRFLQAGMMEDGLVMQRQQGAPQGGPLSPLLSNILLDELDRELEKRGHCFVRYADDCNIYVRTRRAGERVLVSVERFLWDRLRLVVNRVKSAVGRSWERKFLGYTVTRHRKPKPKLKVAGESVERFKGKVRERIRRGRGQSLGKVVEGLAPLLRGWGGYCGHAEVKGIFEELDGWVRRKLRSVLWRQCKRRRTRAKALIRLGIARERAYCSAFNGRGPWWNAGASHMNQALPTRYFRLLGLPSLQEIRQQLQYSP